MRRRRCFAQRCFAQWVVIATAIAFLAGPADADGWPSRPVTMVIPFGAASGIDVLGRTLAPALSDLLGQQVIGENVGGAG